MTTKPELKLGRHLLPAVAALALFEASDDPEYLARAESWAETAHAHYWDDADGGYYLSADDTTDIISRTKTVADHATPSGNGVMVEALARLWHLTGKPVYRERADAVVRRFSGDNPQYLISVPGLLTAFDVLENARTVVIVGERDDAPTKALRGAARSGATALTIVSTVAPDTALPETHPAAGKTVIDHAPAAYVCAQQTCGPPVTDADALRKQLAG